MNNREQEIFSPIEKRVIRLLGAKKRSVGQLTDLYFLTTKSNPMNPNAVVSSAILRINKKCAYYKLPWHIESKGLGRGGKTVWKSKK